MRKVFLLLVILALITPLASAATAAPYILLDQRGYMPSGLFMFISAVALVSLVASYRWLDEMCGFISIATSFIMMWTSRTIDYVTGVAIDSTSAISVVHTIYKPDTITLFAGICFVLALLNLYRLYILSKQDTSMQGQSGQR